MTEQRTPRGIVASPASTGGAGTYFEQHVDAAMLAMLLVRGIPPILTDCQVKEVHFQTEHLGWSTDDVLVVGETGGGRTRKLAGQVKRGFTVSYANEECRKAISDCWWDFRAGNQFSAVDDRFAIVTLRGSNTLLESFCGLLDCARSSRDAADFEHRLMTPGFVRSKTRSYCNEIRKIVDDCEGHAVPFDDLWQFLKLLHVLSFDLNTSTRQTEALIKTLLAHTCNEQDVGGAAEVTWNALLQKVGEGIPTARSYRWNDLPKHLRQRHGSFSQADDRAL